MTDLQLILTHLEKDLEQRMAGGESCPKCCGWQKVPDLSSTRLWVDCSDCQGTGRSSAITAAESALVACRREKKRVERLVGRMEYVKMRSGHHWVINALAEYNAPVLEENQ